MLRIDNTAGNSAELHFLVRPEANVTLLLKLNSDRCGGLDIRCSTQY